MLTAILAVGVATWGETRGALQGFLHPPGFRNPLRHALASGAMAMVLWLAVFQPLSVVGQELSVDVESLPVSSLFLVQGMLLMAMAIWWLAGWAWVRPETLSSLKRESSQDAILPQEAAVPDQDPTSAAVTSAAVTSVEVRGVSIGWRQRLACLGLDALRPVRELLLGLGAGFVAWGGVLAAVIALAGLAALLGADAWASEPPSEIIVWMVELGIGTRLLISLSAGVTEELFFRGYLQPRIGLWASTACFVAAHAGYGRPFMLVGVALLSLLYGLLTRWRGSIWAAISAHFLFDAVQLLVVIPAALGASQGAP